MPRRSRLQHYGRGKLRYTPIAGKGRGGRQYYKVHLQRPLRLMTPGVHHFKQTYHPSIQNLLLTGAVGGNSYDAGTGTFISMPNAGLTIDFFTYHFTFGDLPQQASFAALFDSYKINKIVFKMEPMATFTHPNAATNAAALNYTQVVPTMFSVLDFDDSNQLASENAALEYDNFKQTRAGLQHKRVWRPKISAQVFKQTGTTIGFQQSDSRNNWIDMAYTDVINYGIKAGVQSYSNAAFIAQAHWRVYVTVYFSCRQLR